MTDRYALDRARAAVRLDPGLALNGARHGRRLCMIMSAEHLTRMLDRVRARRCVDCGRRVCRPGSTSRASPSSRRAMRAHGDMATNAAMVLAKDAGKKPRDLA